MVTVEGGAKPGLRDALASLHHRNFALLWTGALLSNTGTWVENVTVPFIVYGLTRSAAWLGFAAFMQFIPIVITGPLAGSIADRYDRRTILVYTQSTQALVALALWALWASGNATTWSVIGLVALSGVVNGINAPSWQAFVTELVPREALLNAVTLNSTQYNASRAFGPALGGVLLAAFGVGWALMVNVVSFAAVIIALLLISAQRPGRPETGSPESRPRVLREFFATFGYVRRFPGIVASLVVAVALGALGSPLFSLLVVFAREVFDVGDAGYGLLGAALGVGSILAAPLIAGPGTGIDRRRLTMVALVAYGVALLAFSLAPSFAVGLAALLVAGGGYLAISSTLNTTIQLQVDEEMRGKVLSIYIVLLTLALPVGSLIQGWAVDRVGPRQTVLVAGILFLAVTFWLRLGTDLMGHLDDDGACDVANPVDASGETVILE